MTTLESLYEIAQTNGIIIENFPMPNTVSASVCLKGKYYIGIDRNQIETSREEAVRIAHELGHCETDSFYDVRMPCTQRTKQEKRAQEWAISYLVPLEKFRNAYDGGCREIWEFADELNITCEFAEKVMLYYKKSKFWL